MASVNDTAGHHPGAGFRFFGGGRKNKFMHIWARVKAWHTVQRLGARQIDLQDVWLNLDDQMELEIDVYTYLKNQKKLEAGHLRWLDEVIDSRSSRGRRGTERYTSSA